VIIVIVLPPLVVGSRPGAAAGGRTGAATGGRTGAATVKALARGRRSQLVERDLLDLPDTLCADPEHASELAQRARGPVEAEALVDDPVLAFVELVEQWP
jgi:hypothetical protein